VPAYPNSRKTCGLQESRYQEVTLVVGIERRSNGPMGVS
jgi:hypothetical protein